MNEIRASQLPLRYCMKCNKELNWSEGEESTCKSCWDTQPPQVSVEPEVKVKLAEYVKMNFDKYWDEMGEAGAENYFETATQKELIAYGQFRAFENVLNFLEGNSKFSD